MTDTTTYHTEPLFLPLRPMLDSRPRPKHKARRPIAPLIRANALLIGLIGGGVAGVVLQAVS